MKTSLVIDGNYLLYKGVFILFQERTLYSDLSTLLRNDLNNLVKMFAYDTIYFVSDSKMRWRQEFYKEYKQNRVQDEKIDWVEVFNIYNDFKEEIKQLSHINSYEVDWLEGDDLISYIVKENNKMGISNVIIASDGDLHQLLNFDMGLEYINIMHNYKFSDERTYWPHNYQVFLSEMFNNTNNTLFDMNEDSEFLEFLEKLSNKTKIKEVIPEETLFCKLITGDKKDNVTSVYIKNNRGIGDKGSLNIYKLYKETYNEDIDFDSDDFIYKLTELISYNKKITDKPTLEDIKNNLIRNRKLKKLDENYLPPELKTILVSKVKIY